MNADALRILVVDDEQAIRRFLRTALGSHGFKVFEAASGRDALAAIIDIRPDLVILDLGLPDIGGLEITRQVREWSQVPIVIVSVREQELDKIAALDAGADDYLTKPFGTGELLARMRASLRRAAPGSGEPVFSCGELTVDLAHRLVTVAGREVQLTPTEYDMLRALVVNAGKVLTHSHLLRQVWGAGNTQDPHLLRVNMSNLRRKLEADPTRPRYIMTEPGVGYRLRLDWQLPAGDGSGM